MTNVEKVTEFRKRRKINLVKIAGCKCALCGYDRAISALEFHHINEEEKSYQLSSGNCHKIEEDITELRKCILVCANCHREIHSGVHSKEELFAKQFFNEGVIEELSTPREKKEYVCSKCGKPITRHSSSGMCAECVRQPLTSNRPTREELKEMIRTMPFTEIGLKYSVSDNAVKKWCDKVKLPRTKREINSYSNEQWEDV